MRLLCVLLLVSLACASPLPRAFGFATLSDGAGFVALAQFSLDDPNTYFTVDEALGIPLLRGWMVNATGEELYVGDLGNYHVYDAVTLSRKPSISLDEAVTCVGMEYDATWDGKGAMIGLVANDNWSVSALNIPARSVTALVPLPLAYDASAGGAYDRVHRRYFAQMMQLTQRACAFFVIDLEKKTAANPFNYSCLRADNRQNSLDNLRYVASTDQLIGMQDGCTFYALDLSSGERVKLDAPQIEAKLIAESALVVDVNAETSLYYTMVEGPRVNFRTSYHWVIINFTKGKQPVFKVLKRNPTNARATELGLVVRPR